MRLSPTKPARYGGRVNALVTILQTTAGKGAGGVGIASAGGTLVSNQPCVFQEMSSSERQQYRSLTEETLYTMFLPTISDGGTDIRVKGVNAPRWTFVIDGVKYETLGAGVEQGDGWQRVPLRRLGAFS